MTLPEQIVDNGKADRNFRGLDDRITTVEAQPPTAPTFATGWSNVGGAYQTASYYKANGRVYLSGTVANGGTGTGLIFTLPSGYRPAASVTFAVTIGAGIFGWVVVASDGTVTDGVFDASSKAALSLDTIDFRVSS